MLEYLALHDMGINIDNSMRLTAFIRQDTINSSYKQLAQTIFTTRNMTMGRAISLYETNNPPSTLTLLSDTPTVTPSVVGTARKDHKLPDCPQRERGSNI